VKVDAARIAALRDSGASWSAITRQLAVSAGTAKRAYYRLSKNPSDQDLATPGFYGADFRPFGCPQTDDFGASVAPTKQWRSETTIPPPKILLVIRAPEGNLLNAIGGLDQSDGQGGSERRASGWSLSDAAFKYL
jgi:hypothetical protein